MSSLLSPLAFIYEKLVHFRNQRFDSQKRKSQKLSVPVISVGNISVGGTGKTPMVMSLLYWAQKEGLRAGVISRGYKSQHRHPRRVNFEETDAAHLYGDEPTMIAKKWGVPVYVGVHKVQVGQLLLKENKVDFIIADDAFQHRQLARDLDIVLIDALSESQQKKLLPAGRLREPYSSLKRADFIVITRANLATTDEVQKTNEIIQEQRIDPQQLIESRVEVAQIFSLNLKNRSLEKSSVELKGKRAVLISALGQPLAFERLAEKKEVQIIKHFIFDDHHEYTSDELECLTLTPEAQRAEVILTTEKDAVKLMQIDALSQDWREMPIYVIEIENHFSPEVKGLYDEIHRLLR